MRHTGVLGFTVSFFRGSLPWDIHKFVSDSPHGLDIFFCCYLPQFLADIPDDTEYSAAYIHRFLLPDCPIDLLFRENSSWLTGKVRQGVKFVILCQRNFLPLIRCLVAERVNTESGILKDRICIRQCLNLHPALPGSVPSPARNFLSCEVPVQSYLLRTAFPAA